MNKGANLRFHNITAKVPIKPTCWLVWHTCPIVSGVLAGQSVGHAPLFLSNLLDRWYSTFETWRHMRRNQIWSFARNGRVHLNRPGGRGVSSVDCWQPRCAPSAVVMLNTPCSEVVWRVLATHSTCILPLHFPYRASPCAIRFHLSSKTFNQCFRVTCWIILLTCPIVYFPVLLRNFLLVHLHGRRVSTTPPPPVLMT